MIKTFRAMQTSSAGLLELVERKMPVPGPDEVLIQIEACGVCGADLRDIERSQLNSESPRIPGHEIVGRIAEKGASVPSIWQDGQRVGVGRLGGHCQNCHSCREGLYHLCENQLTPGLSCDGGYAEYVVIRHTALAAIPHEMSSVDAAPILCAGTATFNALRNSGAKAGDKVAIVGMGGLGHLAIQYARKMGFEVYVIARDPEKKLAAIELGAHHFCPVSDRDGLKSLGRIDLMLVTAPDSETVSALMTMLAPRGKAILLGTGASPVQIMPGMLIGAERSLVGSFVSTPAQTERALRFSRIFEVLPTTQVMPLKQANEALARLRQGKTRYRMVLTMAKDD